MAENAEVRKTSWTRRDWNVLVIILVTVVPLAVWLSSYNEKNLIPAVFVGIGVVRLVEVLVRKPVSRDAVKFALAWIVMGILIRAYWFFRLHEAG